MRVTPRQLRRIIREAFEDHIRRRPKEPMLIELEWDSGRNEVITVPEDIEAEFREEKDRDRWAADSWLMSWLDDEFGEGGDLVSRWRYANSLQDTEIDPELKRWVG